MNTPKLINTQEFFLCPMAELKGCKSRSFTINGQALFIVKEAGNWYAYRNRCPHQGIKLDWGNEQFLDWDNELIQCSSHGALFTINTGRCVAGPCVGDSLDSLPLTEKNTSLLVTLSD